jgi:DNA-binding FadR family transcriptional regulator
MMIVSNVSEDQTPLGIRTSRAEQLAQELQREIAEGRAPGERLGTKDDLRRRFAVALATVNEAVRMLETHGLVQTRPGPGGGVFVARPDGRLIFKHAVLGFETGVTSYEECLELRDALEPAIDRHAARHHTTQDIADLNGLVAEMERVKDDPRRFFAVNWALHRKLGTICRNGPLRAMYLSLIDFLESTIGGAEFVGFDGDSLVAVHRELVAAIASGDGRRLERAAAEHRPSRSDGPRVTTRVDP